MIELWHRVFVEEVRQMAAKRYTLRLYWLSSLELQEDTNLDINDEVFLRQTLERMVLAKRGTLKLDLSQFSMVVHNPGGGMRHRRVKVLPSGATQVGPG
jgi:hypothetical protein